MNKQELIDKLKKLLTKTSEIQGTEFDAGHDYGVRRAIVLTKQLEEQQAQINKPEKPVVPQFVADWYEENEDDFEDSVYDFCIQFSEERLNDDLYKWFCNDDNKPIQTLANMHQFGYEVKKEKLYTVEIPNPNGFIRLVLCKDCDGKLFVATFSGGDCWETFGKCKLTESEIKKDFEWAWKFAKEVEND